MLNFLVAFVPSVSYNLAFDRLGRRSRAGARTPGCTACIADISTISSIGRSTASLETTSDESVQKGIFKAWLVDDFLPYLNLKSSLAI